MLTIHNFISLSKARKNWTDSIFTKFIQVSIFRSEKLNHDSRTVSIDPGLLSFGLIYSGLILSPLLLDIDVYYLYLSISSSIPSFILSAEDVKAKGWLDCVFNFIDQNSYFAHKFYMSSVLARVHEKMIRGSFSFFWLAWLQDRSIHDCGTSAIRVANGYMS